MSDFPEIILDSLQLYEKAVIENVKNDGITIIKDKVCEQNLECMTLKATRKSSNFALCLYIFM